MRPRRAVAEIERVVKRALKKTFPPAESSVWKGEVFLGVDIENTEVIARSSKSK